MAARSGDPHLPYRQAIRPSWRRSSRPRDAARDQDVASRSGRWTNREGRASPLDADQDQGARRRPASSVEADRAWDVIDHPARRRIQLVRGTYVLVTGIVVAPVACRSNPRRPAVDRLGVRLLRGSVSGAVRFGTVSRALRDLHD
jgi:hypothetical protein